MTGEERDGSCVEVEVVDDLLVNLFVVFASARQQRIRQRQAITQTNASSSRVKGRRFGEVCLERGCEINITSKVFLLIDTFSRVIDNIPLCFDHHLQWSPSRQNATAHGPLVVSEGIFFAPALKPP